MAQRRSAPLRRLVSVTAAAGLACALAGPALAKVTSVSTDGEATVYLNTDFGQDFDLAYDVTFEPAPENKSWSTVSILLVGAKFPSASVSVGLSRGYPNATTLSAFTTSAHPNERQTYRAFPVQCMVRCRLELRAQRGDLYALVDGRELASWPRWGYPMANPAVQVNGEVGEVGDRLSASLVSARRRLAGVPTPAPTCAFTTQGIEPRALGTPGSIAFAGSRRPDARVTYIALADGSASDSCPEPVRSARGDNR
jgi:hypothetical protein